MAKPKGVPVITQASLSAPKTNVPGAGKQKKVVAPNAKAMSALFGKKPGKQAVQSTPTKIASL